MNKKGQLEIMLGFVLLAIILLTVVFGLPLVLRFLLHISILSFVGILISLFLIAGISFMGLEIGAFVIWAFVFAASLIILPFIFPHLNTYQIITLSALPGPP